MSQEREDSVAAYLGLQGFDVIAVERVLHPRRGRVKIVRILRRDGHHECPDCGRRHARSAFAEIEPIRLRDSSIGDLETYLEARPNRIACFGGARGEGLPFAMPNFRMTRRFFERIAALCTRLPVAAVAEMAKLSWAAGAKVDGRAIQLAPGDPSEAPPDLHWVRVVPMVRTRCP